MANRGRPRKYGDIGKAKAARPVLASFLEGLRPAARLSISEWADKYRVLSGEVSSEPGRWRTSRVPFMREIMDAMGPYSGVQEIVFVKGSQVGGTEGGLNALGYYMDERGGLLMYVMPTEDTVKRNSRLRFMPMVNASPRLSAKMKRGDGTDNVKEKSYAGGSVLFVSAESPSGLRSVPCGFIVLDELDGMPLDSGGEGSPVSLARARQKTYGKRRKLVIISTPVREDAIWAEWENTTQEKYHVPCPHCGALETLEFHNLRWEDGRPETAVYVCPSCDGKIRDRHKTKMLAHGQWRPTAPQVHAPHRRGFHLSSLYSPDGFMSFGDVAQAFVDADTPEKLQVFYNTVLGVPYSSSEEKPDWRTLYDRRAEYDAGVPPADVVLLTAGVDVQADRVEVEVVGWKPDGSAASVQYAVLEGDTSNKGGGGVWSQLSAFLAAEYVREDGAVLTIERACVDSGYNAQEVYAFCDGEDPTRVSPVKGMDGQNVMVSSPRTVQRNQITGQRVAGSVTFYTVGTSTAKAQIYGRLRLAANDDGTHPPGWCDFPRQYGPEYFKMLTAEQLERRKERGYTKFVWVKVAKRNEALDCRVYAMAALHLIGAHRWTEADWDAYAAQNLMRRKEVTPPAAVRKSSFWD